MSVKGSKIFVYVNPEPTNLHSFLIKRGGAILKKLFCCWNESYCCALTTLEIHQNGVNKKKFVLINLRKEHFYIIITKFIFFLYLKCIVVNLLQKSFKNFLKMRIIKLK